jgi:hypothetical protein
VNAISFKDSKQCQLNYRMKSNQRPKSFYPCGMSFLISGADIVGCLLDRTNKSFVLSLFVPLWGEGNKLP